MGAKVKYPIFIGDKFFQLEVIEIKSNRKIVCKCSCGNFKEYRASQLNRKTVKSCGCFRKNRIKKHGLKNTKIYNIWSHMKRRCYNKNMNNYKWYGAKGIKVCDEWKNDFINFYFWAISNGYKEGLTIERKNNDKNYCPENCCWIPLEEQNKNKHNSIYLTIFNETKLASDWSKDNRCKVSSCHFYWRLKRNLKPEFALTLPPKSKIQKEHLNENSNKS